jgi:hypothetical protein
VAGIRADQPDFPYTAYVSIDDAYVRSGPGKHYYPTDKLVRGDAVEVYRQDPGGWLAIRPPHKSFSWVPASRLQPTRKHLAIVTGDRVASHVGSRLDESRDVVQVRLERGEEVEIIAAEPITVDGQQELWCKIAPPSGEFRWIYGKFVDRTQPAPMPPEIVREPIGTPPSTNGAPTYSPAPDVSAASSDAFDSVLIAVDLALSATVVQDMSTWRFDDLERRAERVLDRAQTSDQHSSARQLLDRIAKFEDIKRRSDAIAGIDTGLDRHRLLLTSMTVPPATSPLMTNSLMPSSPSGVTLAGATSRYNAVGKLTTVKSLRPNAPPYALLNADREPVAFLTPMPGVDLRPLLGRQIGVTGQRGYMPQFHKTHITVMQADPVDASDVLMALRDQMRR